MVIGFLFGCLSALLFKHVDLRHSVYEMGVYLLLAYIPSLFSAVCLVEPSRAARLSLCCMWIGLNMDAANRTVALIASLHLPLSAGRQPGKGGRGDHQPAHLLPTTLHAHSRSGCRAS